MSVTNTELAIVPSRTVSCSTTRMVRAPREVTIAAPIEVVWAHLTTAEGLVRWVGPDATADPAPGGVLRWTHQDGATVVGRFVELVPHAYFLGALRDALQ
jgi:Activator of Hsp90 ATPase homolog 1-like protein